MSDTDFDGATKTSFLIIERAQHETVPRNFEPDVLNTFCATWVGKLKLLQENV